MATSGGLRIHVFKGNTYFPIENAQITVIQQKEASNRQLQLNLSTDSSGVTSNIELEAPPLEYSLKPSDKQPYNLCKIVVEAPGYNKLTINGCQIYPGVTSIQSCCLNAITPTQRDEDTLDISANTLYGDFPSKVPEFEMPDKYVEPGGDFAFSIAEQRIPDSIIVHDGDFNNPNAPNFDIYYKEYIKSVLASEIYPTWPTEALRANAYAVMSFTLNRVFTEWYRGKGKNFHITSSTSTDHKYTRGKNFSQIDTIVNEIFPFYIKKPNYEFPLLTQYTDGKKVPLRRGWMTQWGSCDMAAKGKTATEILKYYYGTDISLYKLNKFGPLHESFSGTLQIGSKGESVKTLQKSLNLIAGTYVRISKVKDDGVFDKGTKSSVENFQTIFSLPKTGKVDFATWYRISDIYVALVNKKLH